MAVLMFVIAYTSKMSRFFDLIANRRRLTLSFEYERTHAERSLAGASHKEDFGPKKIQHFYTWGVIPHLAKTYFSDLATLDKKRNLFFSENAFRFTYSMGVFNGLQTPPKWIHPCDKKLRSMEPHPTSTPIRNLSMATPLTNSNVEYKNFRGRNLRPSASRGHHV